MDFNLVLVLGALLIGFSKGGLGGPVPVALTAPLLSLAMPVSQAVGLVLPLLIFADIFALRAYWREWDMRYVRLMLPAGLLGVLMGVLLLAALADQDRVLRIIIGIIALIAALYKLVSDALESITYRPQDWHGYLAGWSSALMSSLANSGAPPFTAYMLLQKVTPQVFIGTSTLFFAIINLAKLPGFFNAGVIDIDLLLSILWVLPVIVIAIFFARWLIDRIDPAIFNGLMLALPFAAGIYLLVS